MVWEENQNNAENDMSMEDVLASIRKIISTDDENDGSEAAAASADPSPAASPSVSETPPPVEEAVVAVKEELPPPPIATPKAPEEAPAPQKAAAPADDDVLELTHEITADGSIVDLKTSITDLPTAGPHTPEKEADAGTPEPEAQEVTEDGITETPDAQADAILNDLASLHEVDILTEPAQAEGKEDQDKKAELEDAFAGLETVAADPMTAPEEKLEEKAEAGGAETADEAGATAEEERDGGEEADQTPSLEGPDVDVSGNEAVDTEPTAAPAQEEADAPSDMPNAPAMEEVPAVPKDETPPASEKEVAPTEESMPQAEETAAAAHTAEEDPFAGLDVDELEDTAEEDAAVEASVEASQDLPDEAQEEVAEEIVAEDIATAFKDMAETEDEPAVEADTMLDDDDMVIGVDEDMPPEMGDDAVPESGPVAAPEDAIEEAPVEKDDTPPPAEEHDDVAALMSSMVAAAQAIDAPPLEKEARDRPESPEDTLEEELSEAPEDEKKTEGESPVKETFDADKKGQEPLPTMDMQDMSPIEGIVMRALQPILHEWLDKNLPTLVENAVKNEVGNLFNKK